MKNGLLECKKVKTGHTSVNAQQIEYITSTSTLERYRHMSLDERVSQLNKDTNGEIIVSKTVLWTIYKENQVVRRNASFKFHRKNRSPFHFRNLKIKWLNELLEFIRQGRQIIYMDETSTHLWEKMRGFWMRKDDLIDVSLNKDRDSSVTLIGGISNRWDNMEYIITDKTTIVNFQKFLKHIQNHITSNCVMVLDNHSAHRNVDSINMAFRMGIHLHFLPATASELNPVERMWSFFKKKWR